MTAQELRDAIFDEFLQKYYQSELCEKADNFDIEVCNFGKIDIEGNAMELLEELADATIDVMNKNEVLRASKRECKI